ncbi:hypothetical protein Ccrd_018381 [Cynara cardunculus var. scolymus]|uniref:Uncharacterized protein n=1 Tax=Cynara cardunculus var. scolymus TaxID=59895 RepID=A0A103Y6B9_CYNCS|nr:hypothetical protein Ccrd_018381 [Cynara cardunculus var. scolymus]
MVEAVVVVAVKRRYKKTYIKHYRTLFVEKILLLGFEEDESRVSERLDLFDTSTHGSSGYDTSDSFIGLCT